VQHQIRGVLRRPYFTEARRDDLGFAIERQSDPEHMPEQLRREHWSLAKELD
jgi:hypothetical protein